MRISTSLDKEIQFVSRIPDELQYLQIFGSDPFEATGSFGQIFFQRVVEKKYTFWHSIYKPVEDTTILVQEDSPWLGFRVMLKHHLNHVINGSFDSYLKQGQFNFGYSPTIENQFDLKKDIEYCTFDMRIDEEFFSLVNRKDKLIDEFLSAINKSTTILLFSSAMWCNIYSQDAIAHLVKYPRNEAIAIQLVKSLLESAIETIDKVSLAENTIEAIYYARELIKQDLLSHISISDLAKKCGTNATSLKKGFFQIFNKTPYKYLVYERLKLAK